MRDEKHGVDRATVKLMCVDGRVCGETNTDANGFFIFFNLRPRDDYAIRLTRQAFYPLEVTDYESRAGFDVTYAPISLEHCPRGNCDPKLRPKHPLVVCE